MVAMNDMHQPAQVPGLILESGEEVRRFAEAMQREATKKERRANKDVTKKSFDIDYYSRLLVNERCLISGAK